GSAETMHHSTSPALVNLWSRSVRHAIFKAELLQGLQYDVGLGSGNCQLSYRAPSDTDAQHLACLQRPSESILKDQLEYVRNYAFLRNERAVEIEVQVSDIHSFVASVVGLQPRRFRYTLELLEVVQSVTVLVEMRIKHALGVKRPVEFSPQVQPMIPTPQHGSYPSGHTTEAFIAAFMIDGLIRAASARPIDTEDLRFVQLMRHAERIALNRVVAGVHFPIDNAAGMVLAWTLSEYYMRRFGEFGTLHSRNFDGTDTDPFDYRRVLNCYGGTPLPEIGASPELVVLWLEAKKEWEGTYIPLEECDEGEEQ
ncbi:MAG: phosphatase PAP2 family protein, partial [Paracoccaceae bacterium]